MYTCTHTHTHTTHKFYAQVIRIELKTYKDVLLLQEFMKSLKEKLLVLRFECGLFRYRDSVIPDGILTD